MTAPIPAVSPWRQSLEAARANLIPGLILQAFALAVVLAYYNHEPTRASLDSLASFKTRWGWRYSLIATSLFGGLIPFLYLRGSIATRDSTPVSHGVFYVLFWAMKGVEVDMFYRLQGWLFGDGVDVRTIVCKLAVDQLVYSIIWSTPTTMLAFYWKDAGFSFGRLRRLAWIPFLREHMPKTVIGLWGVWIPAVTIIYSLPAALQIPLFNIVLCFYALLFAALSRRNADR